MTSSTREYRLLKQMAVKEGQSYTAEHVPSGRAVLVHMLEEDRLGGAEGLRALLERLAPRDRARVLETFTVDGSLVVVTQFLQDFEGLETLAPGPHSAAGTPPPAPPRSPREAHGEFTRLFRSSEDTRGSPGRSPAAGVRTAVGGVSAPGSNFTDLFRAPVPTARTDRQTAPPYRRVTHGGTAGPDSVRPSPSAPPLRPPEPQPGLLPRKLTPNFETSGRAGA